ncbi:YidB family protein [Ottowia thiooxydans]|uniref:YidB family protein n=1 Tax=Ottowia thiooxydans TaxID=219182 RepID=UPI0003F682CB|nr:YidB family protein [Ottowia thiooxydans]
MGLLDSVLGSVLAGQQQRQGGAGGLGDLLGGLLGGGGQGAGAQGGGLGNILGDMLGGGQPQSQQGNAGGFNINPALIAALLPILMNMLSNSNSGSGGGLGGLLNKFNQAGHGDVANSWVGAGDNIPVSGAQVSDAFGQGTISDIAAQLGIDQGAAAGGIAAILPELIDKLTPQGQAPAGGLGSADDIVGMLGRMLQK